MECPKALAEKVGWTKLQIIAQHVKRQGGDAAAVARHLDLATTTRTHMLPAALVSTSPEPRFATVFRLTRTENEALAALLIAHGAKVGNRGLNYKDQALVSLVDWVTGQLSGSQGS